MLLAKIIMIINNMDQKNYYFFTMINRQHLLITLYYCVQFYYTFIYYLFNINIKISHGLFCSFIYIKTIFFLNFSFAIQIKLINIFFFY